MAAGPARPGQHRYLSTSDSGRERLPTLHEPSRPDWLCTLDGADWPCQAARAELAEWSAGDDGKIGIFLVGRLLVASFDLVGTSKGRPDLLASRFLQWAEPGWLPGTAVEGDDLVADARATDSVPPATGLAWGDGGSPSDVAAGECR